MGKKTKAISVKLHDDIYEWLIQEVERDDRTKSATVEQALKEYKAETETKKAAAETAAIKSQTGGLYHMVDVIEHLSQDDKFMERFCEDCPEISHCPAEWNPFYENGCVKEREIKDIENAVENVERVIDEAVA